MSSVLSSLCDETEVVKKRKILAGKKIVTRSESAKARAVVLVSRAALSEWYFYFYYDFKVTLWI